MLTSSYVSSEDIRHVEPLSPGVMRVFKGGKRRKLTHAEKKEKLKEEIRLLESGVAVLKTRDLPPSLAMKKDPVLLPMTVKYSALLYSMHTQQLQVAKMQAALSRCLTDQQHYPLYSHINLSKDWKERQETLVAMRDHKIRTALEFVMSPGRLDDPLKQQFSENQFENDDGDICCVRFETIQFPQVKSLEQVYEALSFYKNNMEIIISEELGHITIRDDYDDFHEEAFHTRIISTNESGITTEGNVVSFRALLSENEGGYKGQPCAVMLC
ncbi:hypothetical protein PHMEG_00033064 [Phytophthora megakarya]|uniref:Uncharacterized protein n=1 Tax=Phytophthora megakarya TaxID=4795 RepID=A0A225UTQ1_9STRA|nr:hypothetical protein PHMEG_00033064 [Phytophthora megakarya]